MANQDEGTRYCGVDDTLSYGCFHYIFIAFFVVFIYPVIWLAKKLQGESDARFSSGLLATVIVFIIATSIFVGGLTLTGFILWKIFG